MSVKLTNYLRDNIIAKFCVYTFGAQLDALILREGNLAREIYNSFYSLEDQKKMKALPSGWLTTDEGVYVSGRGGYSHYIHFFKSPVSKKNNHDAFCNLNRSYYLGYDTDKLPVPYMYKSERRQIKDPDLLDKIHSWQNDLGKFQETLANFISKMKSFLKGITTDTKLFELMPDAKDILGDTFFGTPVKPITALTTTASEILCVVAQGRGEKREGCCDGTVIAL